MQINTGAITSNHAVNEETLFDAPLQVDSNPDKPTKTLAENETPYWSLLFKTLQLHLPTSIEHRYWTTFILLYGFGVAAPAFYSLTEYSGAAVNAEFSQLDMSAQALTALDWIFKGSALVKIIMFTASAKDMFFSLLQRALLLYEVEKEATKIIKHSLTIILKIAIPFLVAFLSGLGTGFVTYKRLKDDDYLPEALFKYCYLTAIFSANLTNYFLVDLLLIKPLIKLWRNTSPSLNRNVLNTYQALYATSLDLLVNKAIDELTNPSSDIASSPQETLWTHFHTVHEARFTTELFVGFMAVSYPNTSSSKALAPTNCAWLIDGGKSLVFLILAMICTLPNLTSGLQASPFVKAALGLSISGKLIGAASYSINILINFYGMWSLWKSLTSLLLCQDKWRCSYENIAFSAAKGLLVALFVASQVGLVLAFPFTYNKRYDQTIATIQLVFTIFTSAGFALLAISGVFEKLANYQLAWKSLHHLQSSMKPNLTLNDIHVIEQYLKKSALALTSEIERAPSSAIDTLYCNIEAFLIARNSQNNVIAETNIETGNTIPAQTIQMTLSTMRDEIRFNAKPQQDLLSPPLQTKGISLR